MIIEEQDKIINNSNLSSKSFDVEENAVLFWVMSNALYTYKERAVLRELAANGWDAHKALGKEDIPIKIKLPTAMEPELVFQDFGCGMNRQDLENYYKFVNIVNIKIYISQYSTHKWSSFNYIHARKHGSTRREGFIPHFSN